MAGEWAAKVKLLPMNRILVAANAGAALRHSAAVAQMSFFMEALPGIIAATIGPTKSVGQCRSMRSILPPPSSPEGPKDGVVETGISGPGADAGGIGRRRSQCRALGRAAADGRTAGCVA